jgi:hypothetical protein
MPIAAAVVVFIQFCFAFHALKTGRPYWWIFVIMAFPVMGCVIYYFVEIFPGSREHRTAHQTARKLAKALQPDAELKRRADELELCGSVDNKRALAAECTAHGMHAEAVRLYESALQGPFASDPALLFALTGAAIENADLDKASGALARLKTEAPRFRNPEVRLLEARLLEARGDTDAALGIYRELVPVFVGLEARYRYGALLSRLGQHQAALQVFNELLTHSRRFASSIEDEQRWAAAAQQAVSGA